MKNIILNKMLISLITLILLYILLNLSMKDIDDNNNDNNNNNNIEFIDIGNNINLRIIRWGNINDNKEIPIILLHGLASNSLLWKGAAEELLKLGHSCIAIDLRGHGYSSKPDDGYDMNTITTDISKLLIILSQNFNIINPLVIGQSYGGNLVLELAHKYPHLITGIVAVDGGFYELSKKYKNYEQCWEKYQPPNLIGKYVNEMRDYFIRSRPDWPETGINGMMSNFEVLKDDTIQPFLTYDKHKLVLKGLYEHRPSLILHEITVPVLFIPAEGGSFQDDKNEIINIAQEVIPKFKVNWFIADHDLHAQYPEKFANAVSEWLHELS